MILWWLFMVQYINVLRAFKSQIATIIFHLQALSCHWVHCKNGLEQCGAGRNAKMGERRWDDDDDDNLLQFIMAAFFCGHNFFISVAERFAKLYLDKKGRIYRM
jgi:hypothetical protein